MAGQALYRRWRSQTFEDVIGQEHISLTLRNALRDGHLSHAYLFTGPRGTGKTSTARILAKAVNCLADDPAARPCNQCRVCIGITDGSLLDLIEIDAASNRGIDEIRELREKIAFRPGEARYKVYIIDEVHMLTKEAFNALLKTLEEPPAHAIFILATTEPDRVPETVRSRCQRFDFRRIPAGQIQGHLAAILDSEGGRAAPEALAAIARRSTGSMRDAISLLDQLLSYGDEMISLERVAGVLGLVDAQVIGELVDAMAGHDAAGGLALLNRMVAEGVDLGQLVDQVLSYFRGLVFVQVTRSAESLELSHEVAVTLARQATALPLAFTLGAIREFLEARAALREQVPGVPQLPIELAFLRVAVPVAADTAVAAASAPGAQAAGRPAEDAASVPTAGPLPQQFPPQAPVRDALARETPARAAPAEQPPDKARAASRSPAESRGGSQPPATGEHDRPASGEHDRRPAGQEASAGDVDLARLAHRHWEEFLGLAAGHCGAQLIAALRAVRTLDAAGGALVMEWPVVHKFSCNVVKKSENRQQVEVLWEQVLGRRVPLQCVLVGERTAQASAPASDEEDFLRGARDLGAEIKRLD